MKVLVLGAGQLARMMALAGAPLNIEVFAYDVSSGHVVHPLTQQLMMKGLNTAITYANVITAEFEHIPHDILDACAASGKFRPTTEAIKAGGDRRWKNACWIMLMLPMQSTKSSIPVMIWIVQLMPSASPWY